MYYGLMLITYATSHVWERLVTEDPLACFGKNTKARLRSTLNQISNFDIQAVTLPLDEAFLEEFLPLYQRLIQEKDNPLIVDIRETTLGNSASKYPYFYTAIYEEGVLLGAIIFSLRETSVSIAYRAFEYEWISAKLPANPTMYAEYLISLHATEIGVEKFIHGKDRNPYGLNASIGLAIFKLGVGCYLRKSRKFEIKTLDTNTLSTDIFILEYPGDSETQIKKGYLVTSAANEAMWDRVRRYPDQIAVETIFRD